MMLNFQWKGRYDAWCGVCVVSQEKIDLLLKVVQNVEDKEKENHEEILSLRRDRHEAIRGIEQLDLKLDQFQNDLTIVFKDNIEIKKVVESNTEVMHNLQKAFDEANTVMITLVKTGKVLAWLIGITSAILALIKLIGSFNA